MTTLMLLAWILVAKPQSSIVEPLATPLATLQKVGQFAFADGSSYYLLYKDGRFMSGPMGMSGRTITGHWTENSNGEFVIEGLWGWINGISLNNDLRRMTLSVSFADFNVTPVAVPKAQQAGGCPSQIYRCYFLVDELVRIPTLAKASFRNRQSAGRGGYSSRSASLGKRTTE